MTVLSPINPKLVTSGSEPFFISKILSEVHQKVSKVVQNIFGYIVRVVVFQIGEMHKKGARFIIRVFQMLSSDPREKGGFDMKRVIASKKLLIEFGGIEETLIPKDKKASIRCMTFTSKDFLEAFIKKGATLQSVIYEGNSRKVLLNPPAETEKFYFPIIDVKLSDGTVQKGALLPKAPAETEEKRMIVHFHSPGRSMVMDRKVLGLFLGAGCDMTIMDHRGVLESTGIPSEEGYCNDAEAVFEKVSQNYPPDKIYLSGYCKGAASAAYLKKKYHHLGVHLIMSNTFTTMKEVIQGYGTLGKIGAHFGMQALRDPSIGTETCMNIEENLKNLPKGKGKFIFLHTDTDTLVPRGSVQRFCKAVGEAGPVHEILRVHPDPKANGHMQPPYEDPDIWARLIRHL